MGGFSVRILLITCTASASHTSYDALESAAPARGILTRTHTYTHKYTPIHTLTPRHAHTYTSTYTHTLSVRVESIMRVIIREHYAIHKGNSHVQRMSRPRSLCFVYNPM